MYQKKLGGAIAIVDKRRSSATETQAGQPDRRAAGRQSGDHLRRHDFDGQQRGRRRQRGASQRRPARSTPAPRTPCCAARPSTACATRRCKQIVVTDSIPLPPEKQLPNIKVLSVAPLLADAIKRIHLNESVSKLFE